MKTPIRILLSIVALAALLSGISYILSGGQTEIINTVQIKKSPYDVSDYLADMRNEINWNPDVQFVEKTSAGPIETGAMFSVKFRQSDTINVTLTQYYPPYGVTFEHGGALEVTRMMVFSKTGEETKVESKLLVTPHGFRRAAFPIIKRQIKAREQENMAKLKQVLEGNG